MLQLPGALHDRETILALKIEAAKRLHPYMKETLVGLEQERFEVLEALSVWSHRLAESFEKEGTTVLLDQQVCALRKVNRQIWALEDEVRRLPEPKVEDVFDGLVGGATWELAKLAKLIAKLNDDRGSVMSSINRLYGCRAVTNGKIYGYQHQSAASV